MVLSLGFKRLLGLASTGRLKQSRRVCMRALSRNNADSGDVDDRKALDAKPVASPTLTEDNVSTLKLGNLTTQPQPFASLNEEFNDEISEMSHRPLNAYMRDRVNDPVKDLRALLEQGCIPAIIQGGGVVMTIAVPLEPLKRDFEAGWTCPKHDKGSEESMQTGPVYDLRIYRDNTGNEMLYRERAYLSFAAFSKKLQAPYSAQFIRSPTNREIEIRIPVHTFNEHLCPGLLQGGKLHRFVNGLSVIVPPSIFPPTSLWVNLERFHANEPILAAHAIAPEKSEFIVYNFNSGEQIMAILVD